MSTMGRSHRSHYSQNYYVTHDRPNYYGDRPNQLFTTHSERQVYPVHDRPPGMYPYASERNIYFGNGAAALARAPTEHSQIIVEHKKPKFGPCAWILMCIFIIFVAVVIICLIIFFTWGKTIQSRRDYDATHQG